MDALKNKVYEISKEFDEATLPNEWKKIQRYDKGKLDDDAEFAKKETANESYNQNLRADMLYSNVIEFSFPLRFCVAPLFAFNYRVFCNQNFRELEVRNECLNQFCMLCCGLGKDMIVDTANTYTTAKKLGETLTPGQNIISKIITGDEVSFCIELCGRFYPTAIPKIDPAIPKIGHLGEYDNPDTQPVAWSCTDILKQETTQATDMKNGYYQIKAGDVVYKAYCDLLNGGYTLQFNYVAQGAPERIVAAMAGADAKMPVGPIDTKMFPQHILGVDEESGFKTDTSIRVNEQAQFPIRETHFNLEKVLKPTKGDEPFLPENKIESIWLFCTAFSIDEETKELSVANMISVESSKTGLINTAMTGNRADLEDSWLFESTDKIPVNKTFGDIDDPDDLPQFYLLNKFKPDEQFAKDSPSDPYYKVANQFRRGNKLENQHNFINQGQQLNAGFTNDLFFTLEDQDGVVPAEGESVPEPRTFKWTLASFGSTSPNDNGKQNCDSDQKEKESAAQFTFVHQVYYKVQAPPNDKLVERTDRYELWPKL